MEFLLIWQWDHCQGHEINQISRKCYSIIVINFFDIVMFSWIRNRSSQMTHQHKWICHVMFSGKWVFLCEKNMFLFTTYHDHVVFVCDFRVYDVGLWLQNQLFESIWRFTPHIFSEQLSSAVNPNDPYHIYFYCFSSSSWFFLM